MEGSKAFASSALGKSGEGGGEGFPACWRGSLLDQQGREGRSVDRARRGLIWTVTRFTFFVRGEKGTGLHGASDKRNEISERRRGGVS